MQSKLKLAIQSKIDQAKAASVIGKMAINSVTIDTKLKPVLEKDKAPVVTKVEDTIKK